MYVLDMKSFNTNSYGGNIGGITWKELMTLISCVYGNYIQVISEIIQNAVEHAQISVRGGQLKV